MNIAFPAPRTNWAKRNHISYDPGDPLFTGSGKPTKLVFVEEVGSSNGYRKVLCRCTCGSLYSYNLYRVRSGQQTSCGCESRHRLQKSKCKKCKYFEGCSVKSHYGFEASEAKP